MFTVIECGMVCHFDMLLPQGRIAGTFEDLASAREMAAHIDYKDSTVALIYKDDVCMCMPGIAY
jgi:hypothetical protein